MILCLETATNVCSVALTDAGEIIAQRESAIDKSHASLLTLFIEEILTERGITAESLDAVAVSKGPGSYTGLRIGVSTAKGICFGANIPLIAVNTMVGMFFGGSKKFAERKELSNDALFCPMIDARRMEVYSALFSREGKEIREVIAEVIETDSYADLLDRGQIVFYGNGADKCREIINHKNALIYSDYQLSALSLADPAYKLFQEGKFEDVAYFEPFYLKDFIATIPRKKIL